VIHGRLILPALRWRDDTGFAHEAGTIAAALGFGVGGFILFGGRPDAVRALTAELRERAGRPLLIAADLERGAGQQFPGLTEFPPPGALASLEDPGAIRAAASTTAAEALSLGINWVLAPDADLDVEPANPIVQSRSFGADPARVADAVAAWVEACQAAGALACVKHFPGHGRTTRDSHDHLPTVDADLATLERSDLVPFQRAIAGGVATVMTGHLRVPALDPTGVPATFSAAVLGYLRTQMKFDGLIVTDALMMGAAAAGPAGSPAVRALAAGCDLLCYPADPIAAHAAIETAIADGTLGRERVIEAIGGYDEALARVTRAAGTPGRGEVTAVPSPLPRLPASPPASEIADRVVARGLLRGDAPRLRAPLDVVIVDDDQGGAWPASPNTFVTRALQDAHVALGPGGSRIVLAFAEPRASKGRAGFGAESLEVLDGFAREADAVILFGHPRLAAQVPRGAPLLVAWHRQRLMQDAAARWILERLA
jgi:beta-glucosidase-like glycosyl hydrolase